MGTTNGDFIPCTDTSAGFFPVGIIICCWAPIKLTGEDDDELEDCGTGGGGDGVFELIFTFPVTPYPFCIMCEDGDEEFDPSPVFC